MIIFHGNLHSPEEFPIERRGRGEELLRQTAQFGPQKAGQEGKDGKFKRMARIDQLNRWEDVGGCWKMWKVEKLVKFACSTNQATASKVRSDQIWHPTSM